MASVTSMNQRYEYKLRDLRPQGGPARLWGNELGREARLHIEAELENAPEGSTVWVDLAGVEVMDISFSTEAFGKVYASMFSLFPGRALVLENPSKYVKVNLDSAFKLAGQIALVVEGTRKWDLIGKTSEVDRPTLEALRKRNQATTPELQADLGLTNLTAVNQRLRRLAESGTITRIKIAAQKGGEQFIYKWPI
jgi:hypothetical protein